MDIFSFAVSQTFDEKLSKERAQRFVLHRICKGNNKTATTTTSKTEDDKLEERQKDRKEGDLQDDHRAHAEHDKDASSHPVHSSVVKLGEQKLIDKYKGTALEPVPDPHKFHQLTFKESLQLGHEQKFKDFELERQKFLKRLTWREVTQFDSESESEVSETDED